MKQEKGFTSVAHYIPLALSIIFIGTSGPLGRLIQISPVASICIRSLIGLITLLGLLKWKGRSLRIIDRTKQKFILVSGIFLAGHWVAYFYSLQLSSVALAMLSMFTYPVITVLLEPFYLNKPFRMVQVPLSLIALAGIYIMLPAMNLHNEHTVGILIGIGSAFLFAARNLIIKKHAQGIDGLVLTTHQLAVVILVTMPVLFFVPFTWQAINNNWHYLVLLGVLTTAMGHSFYVKSLQHFPVSTVSLLSNFTPVVGILLGVFLLGEKLSVDIILGGSLIIFTAIAEIWLSKKNTLTLTPGLD